METVDYEENKIIFHVEVRKSDVIYFVKKTVLAISMAVVFISYAYLATNGTFNFIGSF